MSKRPRLYPWILVQRVGGRVVVWNRKWRLKAGRSFHLLFLWKISFGSLCPVGSPVLSGEAKGAKVIRLGLRELERTLERYSVSIDTAQKGYVDSTLAWPQSELGAVESSWTGKGKVDWCCYWGYYLGKCCSIQITGKSWGYLCLRISVFPSVKGRYWIVSCLKTVKFGETLLCVICDYYYCDYYSFPRASVTTQVTGPQLSSCPQVFLSLLQLGEQESQFCQRTETIWSLIQRIRKSKWLYG